jgi:hypothetical protein
MSMPEVRHADEDDYSNTFHRLRAGLRDSDGNRYTDFLRTLKPDYRMVQRDIALGYAMLGVSCAVTIALARIGPSIWLTVACGSTLIGYWVAYLQLFLHEAAHFNLTDERSQ